MRFLDASSSSTTAATSGEMFFGESYVYDLSDTTPPTIASVYAQSPTKLAVRFNEPVYNSYDQTKKINANISNGLGTSASWSDWFDASYFYINTSTQTG